MGFTRARLARPRLSFTVERPEVPEQVRSRIPQRRRQRPWRLYLVGALVAVAFASIAAMVLRRRFGGAEESVEAEASEQPTMESVPTSEPVTAEATPSGVASAETAAEKPAAEEAQRFTA